MPVRNLLELDPDFRTRCGSRLPGCRGRGGSCCPASVRLPSTSNGARGRGRRTRSLGVEAPRSSRRAGRDLRATTCSLAGAAEEDGADRFGRERFQASVRSAMTGNRCGGPPSGSAASEATRIDWPAWALLPPGIQEGRRAPARPARHRPRRRAARPALAVRKLRRFWARKVMDRIGVQFRRRATEGLADRVGECLRSHLRATGPDAYRIAAASSTLAWATASGPAQRGPGGAACGRRRRTARPGGCNPRRSGCGS